VDRHALVGVYNLLQVFVYVIWDIGGLIVPQPKVPRPFFRFTLSRSNFLSAAPEKPSLPKSFLIVTNTFGILNSTYENAAFYETMASTLMKGDFHITVLYTGEKNPQFSAISQIYQEKGIKLIGCALNSLIVTQKRSHLALYRFFI